MKIRWSDDWLARLKDLVEQGRLLVAGPHPAVDAVDPGPAGFYRQSDCCRDTLDDGKDWAQEDPYVSAGVYENVVVKPFNKVLP